MHQRRRAWRALLLVFACSGCSGDSSVPAAPARPNILLYVVDTLRADSLGSYGHPGIDTPGIDRLAREGALFEDAVAQSSWTRPSLASILTSTYPDVHGVRGREDAVSPELTLLSERLHAEGYRTGCITTNPNIGSFFGFDQGFDEFIELYARRDAGPVRSAELITRSDEVTRRAIEWIDAGPQPFFLLVLTVDPHSPYRPPQAFDLYGGEYDGRVDGSARSINRKDLTPEDKRRARSLYEGEIAFNDRSFSELDDHLKAGGLDATTVTVFTSDHGEEFWEHGLRGHGRTLFEESIRVPLIVRYPPHVAAGERIGRTVESIDIAPTLLELAGLSPATDVDGRSLFAEEEATSRAALASLRHNRRNLLVLREYPWKLVWNLDANERQLFDLASRSGEAREMSRSQPATTEEMFARLTDLQRSNEERSVQLLGEAGPGRITVDELPEDEREALEALGYIGGVEDDEHD